MKNIKHLTLLAAVDEMNATNGGLEVVNGSHKMAVPLGKDRCIDPVWVESHTWTPCDLLPGMSITASLLNLAPDPYKLTFMLKKKFQAMF